jgi:hypothetical protein
MHKYGTTTSLLTYARGLRSNGHDIQIAYEKGHAWNDSDVIRRVADEFDLIPYEDFVQLQSLSPHLDGAYFIRAGHWDKRYFRDVRSVVHAVLPHYGPHGNFYAYVSQWLAAEMRNKWQGLHGSVRRMRAQLSGCENPKDFAHIPHMSDMPTPSSDPRSEYQIPDEAFLVLNYGGSDAFNIGWARQAVGHFLNENRNAYFLAVNTEPFLHHERAIFAPPVFRAQDKADLLGTANVFLHARCEGETFGVALLEAMQVGTQVLSWAGGAAQNHVHLFDGFSAHYQDADDLLTKLRFLLKGRPLSDSDSLKARGNQFRSEAVLPVLEAALMGKG